MEPKSIYAITASTQPMTGERDVTGRIGRRGFMRAGSGVLAATVAAGTAGQAAAQGGQTHTVDMTDELVFDPEEITIATGDTVVWDNVGNIGHSVTAYEDGIPDDAEFFASGGFDSEQAARDAYPSEGNIPGGETYEYTVEVPGDYEYFCIPHEGVGMVGTVHVEEGGGGAPAEEGGPSGETRVPPGTALLGGSLLVALLAPLLFGLFVLFRRGRESGEPTAATAAVEEAPVEEPAVALDHDDFDPWGTATLVAIYFVIVVLLWIFMYFIEFLGRGPTVIG